MGIIKNVNKNFDIFFKENLYSNKKIKKYENTVKKIIVLLWRRRIQVNKSIFKIVKKNIFFLNKFTSKTYKKSKSINEVLASPEDLGDNLSKKIGDWFKNP